ncbi:MAG: hypothetical protein AMXMBFR46_29140 [Acidimicrobiia bacterium]
MIVADVRILDDADLDAAVAVLAHGIREIPLYRWLLGEHADDLDKRAWLARILLLPLLRAGCVAGAEADGRLVGVLAWQPHDLDLSAVTEGALTRDDFSAVIQTPELLERLRELWTEPPLPPPVPDGVNMILVTVLPEVRGGDVLADLVAPVEEYCRERDRPAYLWTGSPRVRDWFAAGWHGRVFAEVEWNGVRLYGGVSGRPLTARSRRRL